ncbi:MAG: hypothetical protein HQL38_00500 [Alphaproteobacteria bacterium]|nr:hypothetical protein [Alphaproteobacteria bacterium]MBF0391133.1 hypothetical protein [Alphaproteobacteria bacterium]
MATDPNTPAAIPAADEPAATEELTEAELGAVSGGISTEPVPRLHNLLKPSGLTGLKLKQPDSL